MENNELTEVKAVIPSLEGLPEPVIEYVMGLVAENMALKAATGGHYYWEDGGDGPEEPESYAFNAELKVGEEFELVTGVEIGYTGFRVLNDEYDIEIVSAPLQTPNADAAIAEIKAQGVDEFVIYATASSFSDHDLTVEDAEEFAANLRAGRKG